MYDMANIRKLKKYGELAPAAWQGFVAFDYHHRYEEAVSRLAGWVRDGRLRYREDILEGIESCPDAIAGLYRGENLGKRLIRVDHDR